jgi:uncharacterized protein
MGEELREWERRFEWFLVHEAPDAGDAAHDLEHVRRVVANARALARLEGADPAIVLPAAWLHDCVHVPKRSDRRAEASRLAAESAGAFLRRDGYPAALIPPIEHAIHAHSFSARVEPRTREAQVVQDADRLDALGAVGLARMLLLGGAMGLPLYDTGEPLPRLRTADDRRYVLDHLFTKLLGLEASMQTASGRQEARRRTAFLQHFLRQLERELAGLSGSPSTSGHGGAVV